MRFSTTTNHNARCSSNFLTKFGSKRCWKSVPNHKVTFYKVNTNMKTATMDSKKTVLHQAPQTMALFRIYLIKNSP